MKVLSGIFFILVIVISGFSPIQGENVEFVCMKTHKASNTCYFNFIVDGGKYRYTDIGCKKSKKRDQVIKEAREGKAALSRDWKIDCPAKKDQ
jgi:hypothetical protein